MGGAGKGKGKAAPPPPKALTAEEREQAQKVAQLKKEQDEKERKEKQAAVKRDDDARSALKARLGTMRSVDICGSIPWSSAELYVHLVGSRESGNALGIFQRTVPGVFVVDFGGDEVVCLRKANEIVSEFMAEQLAVGLNVVVARSRIVRPDEAEFLEIEEMQHRCRPRLFEKELEPYLAMRDAAAPSWKKMREEHPQQYENLMKTFGRQSSVAVLEFIQGNRLDVTSEETLLSLGTDFWKGIGNLCALDIVLNNMDRIPLPVFDNREGNLGNVMVASSGVVGIDQQLNVIKSEHGMEKYLGRVRDFALNLFQTDTSSDRAHEIPQTKSVIAAIVERIKGAGGSVILTDEQAFVLVQTLKTKLIEIAQSWTSGTLAALIDGAEVGASERIIATQKLIQDDRWTAPEIETSSSMEEAQACASFLRRVVATICEAKEEWVKGEEGPKDLQKQSSKDARVESKLNVSAKWAALRASFFASCLLDDVRRKEVSNMYSDDASRSAIGTWSVDQTAKLCEKGFFEERFASKVELLKPELFTSVSKAVECLNSVDGAMACLEGMCVVFSSSKASYFLVYRKDMKDTAFSMFSLIDS